MESFVRALLYIGIPAVVLSILFCIVVQIPHLDVATPGDAAVAGAVVGGLVGLVYGITRRFQ